MTHETAVLLAELPAEQLRRVYRTAFGLLATAKPQTVHVIRITTAAPGPTRDEDTGQPQAAILAAESVPCVAVVRCRLLSEERIRHAFGIRHAALANDVDAGRVFSIAIDGTDHYPAFLFDPRVSRRHLATVIRQLGEMDGWPKWAFLCQPCVSLGRATPLRALAQGRVGDVLGAAVAYAAR